MDAEGRCKVELLSACYRNSLTLATGSGLKTIAFPAISTGIYGYPLHEAAQVSWQAIQQFLSSNASLRKCGWFFLARAMLRPLENHSSKSGRASTTTVERDGGSGKAIVLR